MEEMAEELVVEARVRARRSHMQWLVLCAGVIVASALLEVQPRGIVLPGAPGRPLPGLCVSRVVFHMNCPTCGLTRSFVAMAHGEVRLAFALHRLGPLGFLLVLVQVPLRAYAVFSGAIPRRLRDPRLTTWVIVALVIALVGSWIVNLVTGAAFRTG
jgi:hypothetical protein